MIGGGMKSDIQIEGRFERLVEEYGRFLRQAIIRVCPKDLGLQYDEIEQEARLRLWRALQDEREIHDPASYLYRIAVTATLDAIRRLRRKREEQMIVDEETEEVRHLSSAMIADEAHAPDRETERQVILQKVRAAIARLPDNRRTAIKLHLEGLTTQEIGEAIGWSEPKARNLVYRALADVRTFLKEAGIEYETS
jgi:RNA polymerase sigma-70 factor (ECF subfamily)